MSETFDLRAEIGAFETRARQAHGHLRRILARMNKDPKARNAIQAAGLKYLARAGFDSCGSDEFQKATSRILFDARQRAAQSAKPVTRATQSILDNKTH